ncbi:MAG: transglutaminase family protein [Rhodobacteraceae bacterium]|nr:transglutaminase family protein [Paracoccaceae bacterium]
MEYDIKLHIGYRYGSPAAGGRHLLRMMPRDGPGQRIISAELTVSPQPDESRERVDFFGNKLLEIAYYQAQSQTDFILTSRIVRTELAEAPAPNEPLSQLHQEVQNICRVDRNAPHNFLYASPYVALTDETTAFGQQAIASASASATSTYGAIAAIGHHIFEQMQFDAQATTVDTPMIEAFTNRRGVCQDFSHIMISALRGAGIPAGYVSGFLRTEPPPGQPRLEGADAMHAWVRAWCGAAVGWVEYDPTNAIFAGVDHITVAHGRDYGDVAPVRGAMRLAGGQSSLMAVDVVPVI